MKIKNILIIMFSLAQFFGFSQKENIYDDKGNGKKVESESTKVILTTTDSSPEIPNPGKIEAAGAITASIVGVAADVVFKSIETYLEDRAKKFAGEYIAQGINLKMANRKLPDITFSRKVKKEGENKEKEVLQFKLSPVQIKRSFKTKDANENEVIKTDSLSIAFYEIKSYGLNGSKSLTKTKWNKLDYVIEITLFYYHEKKGEITEKKELKLTPIMIKRLGFTGDNMNVNLSKNQYRSNTFVMPNDSFIGEVSIKIAETNPRKNSAEKILEYYTEYKDDVRTIVNNYLPKAEDEESEEGETGDNSEKEEQAEGGEVPKEKKQE